MKLIATALFSLFFSLFATAAFAQMPNTDALKKQADATAASVPDAKQEAGKMVETAKTTAHDAKAKLMVNLNTAPASDLAKLPGIGPVRAKAIVDGRPYSKVEDLKKVKGLKDGLIAKLKDKVTF